MTWPNDRYAWVDQEEARQAARRTGIGRDYNRRVDVLAVKCPKCGSPAGERCLPKRIGSHLERLLSAGGRPRVR